MSPKKAASFREPGFNPDNVIQYSHTPSIMELKGNVKVKISETGKVTIRKDDPNDPEVYDEVTVSASAIYKIAFMLDETRETKSVSRDELRRD